jgi:hypothetical protein
MGKEIKRITKAYLEKVIPGLTKRDKEIILTLYEQRFLTTEQFQRLLFSSPFGAQRRLKILYEKGFINRLRPLTKKGSAQYVYFLTSLGAHLVAFYKGIKRSDLKWKRKRLKDEVMFLEHTLAINEVYVALKELEKRGKDYKLAQWISEREFKSHFGSIKDILPDAYFKFGYYEEAIEDYLYYDFFLEMDIGTMRLKRFRDKVKSYVDFYLSGNYKSLFHFFPKVLVVATSESRLENLKKVSEVELKGLSDGSIFTLDFLFTTRNKLDMIFQKHLGKGIFKGLL